MHLTSAVMDDLSCTPPAATIGTSWQLVSDRVMGGISHGTMVREVIAGRPAIRMLGEVSLENNGGFVQIALDLTPDRRAIDASAWRGIELDIFGNGEKYSVHLRTDYLARAWQSYRHSFDAPARWQTVQLVCADFAPYRTETALDTHCVRRIGIVAIGRVFSAAVAIGGLRFLA